jgi:hypothetical protein
VILADHPIMYWRLGETAGPFACEESVNRRDTTHIGSPSLGLPRAIAYDSNSSVEFNGINGYVEWDPNLSTSGVSYFGEAPMCSSVFTVEAWVKEKKAPVPTPSSPSAPESEVELRFQVRYVHDRRDPKGHLFRGGGWYSVAIG